MLLELGDEVMDVGPGRRTRLAAIARETAALHGIIDYKTLLRWFVHYLLYGEIIF